MDSTNTREIENISLTVYFILFATCSTGLNGMSIYLTLKYDKLRVPHMYTRMAYASIDILFALSYVLHYVIALHFPDVPLLVKCLTGDFTIAMFFSTSQLTAYIALERYFYFCRPMAYTRYFSIRSITLTSLAIFIITNGIVYGKELLFGRDFQPLIAMCVFTHPLIHNITNLLIFFLPAVVITVFSIYKIIRLMQQIHVDSMTTRSLAYACVSEPMLRRRAAKKGLK